MVRSNSSASTPARSDQVAKLEERSQSLSTSLSEEQTKSDTLEKARSAAIQDARDLLSVQRDLKFEIEELRERLLAREAELESLAAQLGAAQARVRDLETRAVNDTQTHAEMAAEWEKRLEEQEVRAAHGRDRAGRLFSARQAG